jgi:hypothetical protein
METKIPDQRSMENKIAEAQLNQLGLTNSYGNQNIVTPNLNLLLKRNQYLNHLE